MANKIKDLLLKYGISTNDSIVIFHPCVRDRNEVSVLKCNKSGAIFLSSTDHVEISYYENQDSFEYWGADNRRNAILNNLEDNERRYTQFKNLIANKKWMDIGTGTGAVLDLLGPLAKSVTAVEPQNSARSALLEMNYNAFPLVKDVPDSNFDIVTLFHVFEHLLDPIETLLEIKEKICDDGKLIIEVPHANDFLIKFLDNSSFKNSTFWSEHLILHTRDSLRIFLEKAGFKNITIHGFQRYPLANHLHWLANGGPGGHVKWSHLRTNDLDKAYSDLLGHLHLTDTLIAYAQK